MIKAITDTKHFSDNTMPPVEKDGSFIVLEDTAGTSTAGLNNITDEEFSKLRTGLHRYEDKGKIFHMAIIDYLQKYNCVKRCERCCVPFVQKADKDTISVAKPHFYGTRFYSFLDRTLFS